jgi:hypothetical protein
MRPVADPSGPEIRNGVTDFRPRGDEDNQPRGYLIGECGHWSAVWPSGRVDRCECPTHTPEVAEGPRSP